MEQYKTLKKPIILIGYTKTTQNVIDNLLTISLEKRKFDGILLIDNNIDYENNEVLFLKEDSNNSSLFDKINITKSYCVVIFSNQGSTSYQIADLRSVSTVFLIENIDKSIHTITEVQHSENAGLILSKIEGDEVIIKELIDAKVIFSSILNHSISSYIYDILGNNNNRLRSERLSFFGLNKPTTLLELKRKAIELDITLIGYGEYQNRESLLFNNDDLININEDIFFFDNN